MLLIGFPCIERSARIARSPILLSSRIPAGSRRAAPICGRCCRITCTASARRRRTRCRWCGATRTAAPRSPQLARLAHEETSHVVQVARCWPGAGGRRAPISQPLRPRAAGGGARPRAERLLDALLVAAFIEARSHERLGLLARGFAAHGTPSWPTSTRARRRRGAPRRDLPRAGAAAGTRRRRRRRAWASWARARRRSWPRCRTRAGCTDRGIPIPNTLG